MGISILFGVLASLALAGMPEPSQAKPAAVAWVLPRPPYPAAARATHEQGKIIITVTTDATGKVVKADAVPANKKDDLPNLTKMCVRWALAQWHGPPNTTREVSLQFLMG